MTPSLTDEPRTIQAVLDRSALHSFARGHIHVGELLIDVADDDAFMGIPTVALLEAYAETRGNQHATALLRLLVTLPGIAVIDLDAETAEAVAHEVEAAEGDLARSHAVWAAKEHEAWYLTTEPTEVTELLPPGQVHVIPRKDA
ncbi:hypothetical protein [Actinoplanes sp. NPDC026623]|jgi:hypothetical protein|uniref:hypothetical protein n=1 Tax=Actinoplanes sp. NPDC026623 TaxID=3155610 RepID=UPI0033C1AB59